MSARVSCAVRNRGAIGRRAVGLRVPAGLAPRRDPRR
jgi:hypothetical protein